MVGVGANAVPVVGEPLAFGLAFIALLLVTLTGSWAGALTTVAHEGGHMVMSLVTFRGNSGFYLHDGGGGRTEGIDSRWGIGWILTIFAGYATPPLVALGGAAVVRSGNPWGVLWVAVFLLVVALVASRNVLAGLVTFLALAGVVWVALAGSVYLQAAVAVGLVWLLLFGGCVPPSSSARTPTRTQTSSTERP
jgi:hypothetical protein